MCADDKSRAAKKWVRYVSYPVPDDARVVYAGEQLTAAEDSFHMSAGEYAADPSTPAADLIFFEFCPIGAEFVENSWVANDFRQEMEDLVDKKLNADGKIVLPHKMVYFMAQRLKMKSIEYYPDTFERSEHIIL